MTAKYKHTEQDYRLAVQNSINLSDMCRELGILPIGGNFGTVKRKIAEFDIDISHFTGKYDISKAPEKVVISKIAIKKKLIRERGHMCQVLACGLSIWLDKPIALELEHIDGNTNNDNEDNLLLLCPNCHAQTETWRRKKVSVTIEKSFCSCGNEKHKKSQQCIKCYFNRNKNMLK